MVFTWWMYVIAYFLIGAATLFGMCVAEPKEFEKPDGDMVGVIVLATLLWPVAWIILLGIGITQAGVALGRKLKELDK